MSPSYGLAPDISRADWLAARKACIGGSDAAAAVGMSRWKGPFALWCEKRGVVPDEQLSDPEAAEWGSLHEPAILKKYGEWAGKKFGVRMLDPSKPAERERAERALTGGNDCEVLGWVEGRQAWVSSVARPWQRATLDGVALLNNGRPIYVECKTGGEFAASEWRDEGPPREYLFQGSHALAVCGSLAGYALAGLLGGRRFVPLYYEPAALPAPRDLTTVEAELWARVLSGEAPALDASRASLRALDQLHPKDTGETVTLPREAIELHARLAEATAQRLALEKAEGAAKDQLRALIGAATYALLPDGSGTYTLRWQDRKAHSVKASTFKKLDFEPARAGKAR